MLKAYWIIIIREGYRLWIPVSDRQWIDFGHSIQSSAFGEVETCTRERDVESDVGTTLATYTHTSTYAMAVSPSRM